MSSTTEIRLSLFISIQSFHHVPFHYVPNRLANPAIPDTELVVFLRDAMWIAGLKMLWRWTPDIFYIQSWLDSEGKF